MWSVLRAALPLRHRSLLLLLLPLLLPQRPASAARPGPLQDHATRVIQGSAKVQQALGGSVRVMPPVSQSSMSQSINGRASQTVTLILPVVGAGGKAVQVRPACGRRQAGAWSPGAGL